MHSRRIILATILVTSLMTAGCLRDVLREVTRYRSDPKSTQDALAKKFGDEVEVSINDGDRGNQVLTVTFVNSSLNAVAKEDRANRAQEAANLVRLRYPSSHSLITIWIVFVSQPKSLLSNTGRQWVDSFVFNADGHSQSLDPQPTTSGYGVELRTSANYISRDNETDVSVSGILLAGSASGNGLILLPHFRVTGDVHAGKAAPPREVSFDFASYSDRPEFDNTVTVAFIADGALVMAATALLTTRTFSGTVTELLYLRLPYPAFRRLIAAHHLTIRLGSKEYPLDRGQLEALRQMSDYLSE